MKLESQVCSLELAQKLKSLGVKQESHFEWWESTYNSSVSVANFVTITHRRSRLMSDETHDWVSLCSAFTVAELGEMLPKGLDTGDTVRPYRLQCFNSSEGWRVEYWSGFNGERNLRLGPDCYADTEADARAKMMIYLLENHLLDTTK